MPKKMFVSHFAAIFFLQVILLDVTEARVAKQENDAPKVQMTVPENNTVSTVVSAIEEKTSDATLISQIIDNSTMESTSNITLEIVDTQEAIVQQNTTDNDTLLKSQQNETTIKSKSDDETSELNSTDMDLITENIYVPPKENEIQKVTLITDPDFKNYSDCVVVEVIPETQKQLDELRGFEFDMKYCILSHIRRVGHPLKILTLAKNNDLAQYVKTNELEKRITIRDVDKSNFVNEVLKTAKKNFLFEGYSDLEDILSYYEKLSSDKSAKANVTLLEETLTINKSSIWTVKLTERGSTVKKPTILVIAGLHGREWITTVAALKLIDTLVYPVNGEPVKPLLGQFDWLIVPVANPDGYDYSRRTNRYWKKNRPCNGGEIDGCGVDLEMNFDTNKWNASKMTYLNTTDYYAGRVPFSEVETQHIKHLVERYRSELIMYISLNGVENFICYPSTYENNKTENHLKSLKAGLQILKTGMDKVDATVKYAIGSTDELFDENTGRDIDWAYNIMGLPLAYKIGLHSNVSVAEVDVLPMDIERVSQRAVRGIQTLAEYLWQKRGPVREYYNVQRRLSGNIASQKTSFVHHCLFFIIINYISI